ncbi:complement factor H-like [Leptopilina boulardi]|uniref:complement factor H-like n=1 Tax=Leptopilina boulardi TaxID=63433 RepID=UPI0021F59D41|nr:complement factor H-like [Leptopilina boulardi]
MVFEIINNLILVALIFSNQESFIKSETINSTCELEEIVNGYLEINENGITGTLHCNTNYTLYGNSSSICFQNYWLNFGRCVLNDCIKSSMHYTLEMDTYSSEEEIHYGCSYEYELKGPKFGFCTNGKWSNPPPVCELKESENQSFVESKSTEEKCSPFQIENGVVAINKRGTIATVKCNSNYSQKYERKSNIYCNNGIWMNQFFTRCIHNDCLNSPSHYTLTNGDVYPFYRTTSDVKIKYRCNNKYYNLIGEKAAFCIDGKWSNPPPECKIIKKDFTTYYYSVIEPQPPGRCA